MDEEKTENCLNPVKQPTKLDEISEGFLKECGYMIDENLDEIEDMWEPQFPSTDFYIFCATMKFIEYKLNNNPNPDCTIEQKLRFVGFNQPTAAHIEECCRRNKVYHMQSLLYWIDVYFEVKFNQLSPTPSQEKYHQEFLDGEWKREEWHEKQIEIERSTKRLLNIKVIYTSQIYQIPDLIIDGEPINLGVKNGNIWYHGTSAMNLSSIINDGIKGA